MEIKKLVKLEKKNSLGKMHEANNQLMDLIYPRKRQEKIIWFFSSKEFQHTEIIRTVFYWLFFQTKVIHTGEKAMINKKSHRIIE